MNNEEKAKELANHYAGENDYKEGAAYDSAMAMAEWKDMQELEFLASLLIQSNSNIIIEKIEERIRELEGKCETK